MASFLWGKVYYQDTFAGILREEPGDCTSFTYDSRYLEAHPFPLSHTLPLQPAPHLCHGGLHPFFDNLVAEGWLEQAQSRLLGKRHISRFELLLTFGYDCAGAVYVMDPEPTSLSQSLLDMDDPREMALLTSRASLSGVQPKLAIVERNGLFFPTKVGELSTHIAKFPSAGHADLVENEYLTTLAFKALLPNDLVAQLDIANIEGIGPALLIKRFDRSPEGRIHFEEFNQIFGLKSQEKYDGTYKQMGDFIRHTNGCLPLENYRLFARILAGLLLGNTDMHLKNFALFRHPTGLRLTPSYDQVAAALYQYKTVALGIGGAHDLQLGQIKSKHLIELSRDFEIPREAFMRLLKELNINRQNAAQAIADGPIGPNPLKDQLINLMEKRWNGTFALTGQILSTKP